VNLRRQAAFWIGALLLAALFLWIFSGILLPFILGMALAYLLDPIAGHAGTRRHEPFLGHHQHRADGRAGDHASGGDRRAYPRVAAVGFIDELPAHFARLRALGNRFFETRLGQYFGAQEAASGVDQMVAQGASWMTTLLASVWAGGQALIGVVSLIVITPVVAFYILYDWDRMVARLDALTPRNHVETVRRLAREIDAALAGFLRGQGTVCLILGGFYAIALTLIGLDFGFLIGSIAGLINFIPFVGSIVGFVLAVSVALVQYWPDWIWIVAVAGIFVLGQFIEGNILQPRLVGSSIGVHPVWLMFALFAFGTLFGFVGVLLAVPVTAALGVLVRFAVEQYRHSDIYWGPEGPPEDRLL
jgi:predicted PurR-regulated permease PerM